MIQAILFDADGVLIDAGELHFQAFNKALATKGWCVSRAQHNAVYNGLSTVDKLEKLSRDQGLPTEWHREILDAKQAFTREVIQEFLWPNEGRIEMLAEIASEGIAVGVCSNMIQSNLELMVRQAGLAPYVDVCIGFDRVTHGKPHPDVYLTAAVALGLDICRCAIVVDNSISLAAAKKANPLDLIVVDGPDEVGPSLMSRLMKFAIPTRRPA